MTEQKPKSDNELRMFELCTALKFQKAQREKARIANISTEIGILNLETLIVSLSKIIKDMERTGVKRVEIKDSEIETPVPTDKNNGGN